MPEFVKLKLALSAPVVLIILIAVKDLPGSKGTEYLIIVFILHRPQFRQICCHCLLIERKPAYIPSLDIMLSRILVHYLAYSSCLCFKRISFKQICHSAPCSHFCGLRHEQIVPDFCRKDRSYDGQCIIHPPYRQPLVGSIGTVRG